MRFALLIICLSAVLLTPSTQVSVQAQPAETSDQNETLESLDVQTATGHHQFSVEVMRTDAQRAKGLMFRRFLPPDRGMLFDFKVEQPVMMWMKNTFIPLDMIFIARDGSIVSIAENTEPLSERIISSNGPVFAVLEVNGGTAQSISAKSGDRVTNSMFAKP